MKKSPTLAALSLVFAFSPFFSTCPLVSSASAQTPWPSWRGPLGNGSAEPGSYPTQWSPTEHIRWKVELPGRGASTPVLIENLIVFTLGIEGENYVWAVNDQGEKVWARNLGKAKEGKHAKASSANSSPVTDGKFIYTYFKSGELACLNKDGEVVWEFNVQTRYGEDTLWWDLGNSPILTPESLVLSVVHSGPSFLVALDKSTGKELWKADRWLDVNDESNQSYTTPTLSGDQILTVGADHVTSHRWKDGKFNWKVGGLNPKNDGYFRSISSPVVCGHIVVCPYARGSTITGVSIRSDQNDNKRVAWEVQFGCDVPTPAVRDGKVFVLGDKGLVTCLQGNNGEVVWKEQLPKSNKQYSSSPTLAGDYLYCMREDGVCFVVNVSGAKPELTSQNQLEGQAVATPVAANKKLYLRMADALYCVE